MKQLPLLLIFCCLLLACHKNISDILQNTDPRIKLITASNDTVQPLCQGCPPTVTKSTEYFTYDVFGRLVTRTFTVAHLYPPPLRTDTSTIVTYQYPGNSTSSLISGYIEYPGLGSPVVHVIGYDNLLRVISDSVINPPAPYFKLSSFAYYPGYVVVTDKQTQPTGTVTVADTFLYAGYNVLEEKYGSRGPGASSINRDILHTPSAFRNPLSYLNNFNLLSTEYKNGNGLLSYGIYYTQNLTWYFPQQSLVKTKTGSSPVTQYTSVFSISTDSLNRITAYGNTSNGRKIIYFEYY